MKVTIPSPIHEERGSKSSRLLKLWFVFDAVVALAPPIYWAANGRTVPILGMPAALFYFLAVDVCIAASIVAAHLIDRGVEADPA